MKQGYAGEDILGIGCKTCKCDLGLKLVKVQDIQKGMIILPSSWK